MPDSLRCSTCLCKSKAPASHHNTHTPRYALRIRPVVIISVNCFQSACIHPHYTYARHVETFLCHTPVAATTATTTPTTGWVVIVATSRLDLPASQLTNEAPSKRQQNYLYATSNPRLGAAVARGRVWPGSGQDVWINGCLLARPELFMGSIFKRIVCHPLSASLSLYEFWLIADESGSTLASWPPAWSVDNGHAARGTRNAHTEIFAIPAESESRLFALAKSATLAAQSWTNWQQDCRGGERTNWLNSQAAN